MRKLFDVLAAVFLAAALGGCGSDDPVADAELNVTPSEFTDIPAHGGAYLVQVTCNRGWTVSDAPRWIELSAAEGSGSFELGVTVRENDGGGYGRPLCALPPVTS